jgi:hypothetical protein
MGLSIFTGDLELIDRANERIANGQFHAALADLNLALSCVRTPHASWNRAMVLLTLGDYRNGISELEHRWSLFPNLLDAEGKAAVSCAPLWRGEDIAGKRLLLYHEAGYGDSIMLLRFVPQLQAMGAEVTLLMPPPLVRLAAQLAPVISKISDSTRFDYRCPMFSLLAALKVTPDDIPELPYLGVGPGWASPIHDDGRKRIGVCWSSERGYGSERVMELEQMVAALPDDVQLYSLQNHDQDVAARCGVWAFRFKDFAEVAALLARMDAVVSIDTAAINLAGAIGHMKANAVLPFAPVWRWHNPRWFPRVNQCRQDRRGDWASALTKLQL